MDLKELDYIVTVANEGSISRAAEKLFMAQSSLSQAVRLFEQDLGTPIFVRTARGVRPTSAGEAFIFHARQILQQYQEARSEASDIENLKGGTVIFGISTYRGTYLLPPVLKKFHALYPRVHVEICEMDSIDLENKILEGLLDLALIAAPPVRIKHGVDFLMRDEIMIATTADHPVMAFAKPCESEPEQMWIDLKDTAPFEYILGPPSTVLGRTGRRSLREAGVEPLGLDTYLSASFAAAMARRESDSHSPTVPAASCGMSSAICGSGKMVFSSIWRSPGPLENTARGRRWRSRSCFRRWRRSCCGGNRASVQIHVKLSKKGYAANYYTLDYNNPKYNNSQHNLSLIIFLGNQISIRFLHQHLNPLRLPALAEGK